MTDLLSVSALGQMAPRVMSHGALTITENSGLGLASVALRRGAALPHPFGLRLPEPGLWAAGQGMAAFWTGPGQWMIEAEARAEDDFARDVTAHAPGCSVTEQTDGWVCYEIASVMGADPVLDLLAKLVNIDAAAFGPGCATRTGLEHMSVFVIRRAADRLAIYGMRSSAGSLWHAIEATAAQSEGVM